MKYTYLIAVMTLAPVWGQGVHPTNGALTPSSVAAAPATAPAAAVGSLPKGAPSRDVFKRLESDFDYSLKTADKEYPLDLLGYTRGLYLPGYGAVFTVEVGLTQDNILPMFQRTPLSSEERARIHNRKVQHLDLLRKQMRDMMIASAKTLDLGPTDQIVVAVRLLYQSNDDRTGLPDQVVMRADRHGVQTGDIKVDAQ